MEGRFHTFCFELFVNWYRVQWRDSDLAVRRGGGVEGWRGGEKMVVGGWWLVVGGWWLMVVGGSWWWLWRGQGLTELTPNHILQRCLACDHQLDLARQFVCTTRWELLAQVRVVEEEIVMLLEQRCHSCSSLGRLGEGTNVRDERPRRSWRVVHDRKKVVELGG